MVNESIADTYLRSLANERTRSPMTRDLARCAIEAREEAARLRARVAVLERVREAAEEMRGDPVVFWLGDERKDLLLRALDAAKEPGHD